MNNETPSHILVAQRVRNRIIEYLELAASFQEQLAYQLRVPDVNISNEMIEQWFDWVHLPSVESYGPPVYSREEHNSIVAFNALLQDVCDQTPSHLPPIAELIRLPVWISVRDGAQIALGVFRKRGRLSEDVEMEILS
jgi:hypothetical protein